MCIIMNWCLGGLREVQAHFEMTKGADVNGSLPCDLQDTASSDELETTVHPGAVSTGPSLIARIKSYPWGTVVPQTLLETRSAIVSGHNMESEEAKIPPSPLTHGCVFQIRMNPFAQDEWEQDQPPH